MWEQVANVAFREVADVQSAGILIGAQITPQGRAYTSVEFEPGSNTGAKTIRRALICLNPEMPWKIGFDGDLSVYDVRHTIAHEVGHAIGLDHPGASGQVMGFRYDERPRVFRSATLRARCRFTVPAVAGPSRSPTAGARSRRAGRRCYTGGAPFGIGEAEAP